MRKYLSTLHKRSPTHKKRFALLASGGVTLLIFAVWTTVHYPPSGLADPPALAGSENKIANVNEANPFGSLMRGFKSSFENLRDSLKSVELESGYEKMKSNSLNIYGQ